MRDRGVSVPVPVAAYVECVPSYLGLRGYCYRGFVLTEAIPSSKNLLQLALQHVGDNDKWDNLFVAARAAGEIARKALLEGIHHQDLHPGNVLVTKSSETFLIDFDKAKIVDPEHEMNSVVDKLSSRWRRSLTKHFSTQPKFIEQMSNSFQNGLMPRGK